MAIEWFIYEGAWLRPREVAIRTSLLIESIESEPIAVNVVRDLSSEAGSAEEDGTSGEWDCQIEFSALELSTYIDLDLSVQDDGKLLGSITSVRSKLSVVLGLIAAVSWQASSGGKIGGTGLDGRLLTFDESERLVDILFSGTTLLRGVDSVAEKLGCGHLRFS